MLREVFYDLITATKKKKSDCLFVVSGSTQNKSRCIVQKERKMCIDCHTSATSNSHHYSFTSNEDTEKGNKQQFHRCSYEVCNMWEDTMNTQPINTSPFFLLCLSNILEMELERLILYTVLQAKGKLNENVNEDCCVWCVFSLNLLPCSEAFAIAIWNLVNLQFLSMNKFT